MFHAMYEYADAYGIKRYHNAKIGGFKRDVAAVAAITRRGNVGYVTDSNNHVLFIVRNGRRINP